MNDEDNFKARGNFVSIWRIRSKELYIAAEVVWNTDVIEEEGSELHRMYRPAALLMGLCLECSVKGLVIQNDSTLFHDGKLAKKITTHKLLDLFQLAGITISQKEKDTLQRLTENVIWVAKYATPTKVQLNQPTNIKALIRNDEDFNTFKQLFEKVQANYTQEAF